MSTPDSQLEGSLTPSFAVEQSPNPGYNIIEVEPGENIYDVRRKAAKIVATEGLESLGYDFNGTHHAVTASEASEMLTPDNIREVIQSKERIIENHKKMIEVLAAEIAEERALGYKLHPEQFPNE